MSELAQALMTKVLELPLEEKIDFADELDSRIAEEFPAPPSKYATQEAEDEAHLKMLQERMRIHHERPERAISKDEFERKLEARYGQLR